MNRDDDQESPRSINRNFIASLSRGLSILEAVADCEEDIPLAALAKRVGLKKTSTWRLTHTLVQLGYLRQNPETRCFRLSPRVLAFGYAYFDGLDLKTLSTPFLSDLSGRLNETVNLAVLDGDQLVYIERIKTSQIININLHVGSRLALYNTSLGRALISEMPEAWLQGYIERLAKVPEALEYARKSGERLLNLLRETRQRGYALSDEEYVVGLRSVSSPIREKKGKIVAAANIAVPSSRVTISDLRRTFVPELLDTARKISAALGFRA